MVMFGSITNTIPGFVEQKIEELEPELVVECGFGKYTGLIGEWTEQNNARIFSYHHLPETVDKTRALCMDLKSVEVIFSPVNIRTRSYSAELVPSGIDLAIIDGPSKNIGKQETLGFLWDHLASSAEVLLTEADENHEQACLNRWREEFDIDVTFSKDKKIAVITKA